MMAGCESVTGDVQEGAISPWAGQSLSQTGLIPLRGTLPGITAILP